MSTETAPKRPIRFLNLAQTSDRSGFGATKIWEDEQKGLFPRRVKLGTRANRWVESEVEEWLAQKIAERDAALADKALAKADQPTTVTAPSTSSNPKTTAFAANALVETDQPTTATAPSTSSNPKTKHKSARRHTSAKSRASAKNRIARV